ncbi:hypothetical protein KC357_g271 [Hortaea werneckii]|nr:hypothetical protein KC357_g271 [Hortaea werneckii]
MSDVRGLASIGLDIACAEQHRFAAVATNVLDVASFPDNPHVTRSTPSPPRLTATVDSDGSSVHTTPSLRGHAHDDVPGKTDVDSHFRLEREAEAERPDESSAAAESPPPFSSHNFPSRYFPAPSPADPTTHPLPHRHSKRRSGRPDLDDGEPPPPYTEGSSPLDGFTYIMAAAGGAATADENITLELRRRKPTPCSHASDGAPDRHRCAIRPDFSAVHA